jgi:phosphoglycolate phosphatase-like HAD superfamily hydrolase/uridine kinase
MNNLNDINLLIFHLDGTILPSTRPTYEAIKRAFAKSGLPVVFSEKAIEKYFGVSSDEFYRSITPQDSAFSWQDVRLRVRAEYISALTDCACTYPGVRDTLAVLRKRGYKLALCSNSGVSWFQTAISALKLKDYFDYVECVEDCHLSKAQIITKIKNLYNASAAVIGDRIYDIEAARATGSLAVGALYGYGEKEPEQADVVISQFSDLLKIFDRNIPIFEKIRQEIERRKLKSRAFVVGISGIDLSGKTEFTRCLAEYLPPNNYKVMFIHLDDFHNPRAYRNSGPDPVENYLQRNFNLESIIRDLLVPLRQSKDETVSLTLLNLFSDRYEVQKQYSFDRETIVLFEGVFLFRKELSPYLDYKIYLDIPWEESRRRAMSRDIPLYGEDILRRYAEKYWPAQEKHLTEYPPSQIADLFIDNRNWEYPQIRNIPK